MSTQKRVFYAVESAAFAQDGTNAPFTGVKGLQSIGINTRLNLDYIFEVGQLDLYSVAETVPDIECTMEKVLDGTPLLWHLATHGATVGTLVGRSNIKCIVGFSVYTDTNSSASGTPTAQCTMSGLFPSSLNYNFQVQGNSTESVTLVGNSKVWGNAFTAPTYNDTDTSTSVQRRQHFLLGSGQSILPQDIPGVDASGYVLNDSADPASYNVAIQSVRVSANLGREPLYELGRRGPYHRYVAFPCEVRTDIEIMARGGDNFVANEESDNTADRQITIKMNVGTVLDMGAKNRITSITHSGANAGQGGGNATQSYSFVGWNDLTISDPADPSGL